MGNSYLDGGDIFPDPASDGSGMAPDGCKYEGSAVPKFSELLPGFSEIAIGPDERITHISYLATVIFSHKRRHGDNSGFTVAGAVEAAWDIYNRVQTLVDERDAELVVEGDELLKQIKDEAD